MFWIIKQKRNIQKMQSLVFFNQYIIGNCPPLNDASMDAGEKIQMKKVVISRPIGVAGRGITATGMVTCSSNPSAPLIQSHG